MLLIVGIEIEWELQGDGLKHWLVLLNLISLGLPRKMKM
jgi:hypothetical protein